MMRSFLSEWVKLGRLRQLLSVWGVMAGLMVLFTGLIFASAGAPPPPPAACSPATDGTFDQAACAAAIAKAQQSAARKGPLVPTSTLEAPDGLSFGLSVAGNILGIVSLVLFAGNLAGEYSNGTLKILLSRQPRRLTLLTGKVAALFSFAVLGVLLAATAEVVTSLAIGAARGLDLSAWGTAGAIGDLLAGVARLALATLAWGTLGGLLAVLLRSGPAAIGLGIGYVLVGEGLLGLALPDVVRYMPGQVISAFVAGGKASSFSQSSAATPLAFGTAALLMLVYVLVFLGVAGAVFRTRDVAT